MTASPATDGATVRSCVCCLVLRRTLLAALLLGAALGIACWFDRMTLLQAVADWWIVSDPIVASDAAAVLGGGLDDRPFAAADYYRHGMVKKVLVSNIGAGPAARIGAVSTHVTANRAVLLKLGVPESAIEVFGADLANTHQEAVALRQWAERENIHSIIVPTEIFTSRRLRWTLHHVFTDGVTVRVATLEPTQYGPSDWWRHEGGIVAFQNEVVKYIYYRLKY